MTWVETIQVIMMVIATVWALLLAAAGLALYIQKRGGGN
jgi:hypothetical protein